MCCVPVSSLLQFVFGSIVIEMEYSVEKAIPVRTDIIVDDYAPSAVEQVTSDMALRCITLSEVNYVTTEDTMLLQSESSEESYIEADMVPFPEQTHEPILIPIGDVDIEPMHYSIDYSEVIALDEASKKQEVVSVPELKKRGLPRMPMRFF